MRKHLRAWRRIGASPSLLRAIATGIAPRIRPHRRTICREYPLGNDELSFWRGGERDRLLQAEILAEASLAELELVHPAFFVPKGEGFRMVVDLTARGVGINSMIDMETFTMETLEDFTASAKGDEELIAFDVADAFYALAIAPRLQRYFGMVIDGKHYRMIGMPMGFALSSAYLADLMGVVMRHIRGRGMGGVQYADDFLVAVTGSARQKRAQVEWVRELLRSLGLRVKDAKCTWIPTRRLQHLGVVIDLNRRRFEVPDAKAKAIRAIAFQVLDVVRGSGHVPARLLATLAGKAQALRIAVPRGALRLRSLYDTIGSRVSGARRLGRQALRDVHWWATLELGQWAPIWTEAAGYTLHTDASGHSGWGAVRNWNRADETTVQGTWTDKERGMHIQGLEARAVRLAFEKWTDDLCGKHIEIFSDNVAVVAALNKWSSRSADIMEELRRMEQWATTTQATWRATYINTLDNTLADELSRQDREAWTLPRGTVEQLLSEWGGVQVDRFATRENRVVERYFSRWMEEEAEGQDGLTGEWVERSWVFPPPRLVPDVLRKLAGAPDAVAIVIVPRWTGAAWWPAFLRVCAEVRFLVAPAKSPAGRYYAMAAGLRDTRWKARSPLLPGRC